MISYLGLNKLLNAKGIKKSDLTAILGISSRNIAKIGRSEKLSDAVIKRLCDYFACRPTDIYRVLSDNPILQALRDEKSAGVSGGLYHELQVRMTYNSSHIEGSRLTEEQTRLIFETSTIGTSDGIPVDDIIETVHHFRAIDYCIDHAEEPLSEDIIKRLHYILKHDTVESTLDWFAVGEYKTRPNVVGGKDTTKPKDVPAKMKALIDNYNKLQGVSIYDIIEFHSEFEHIHPFQDGNGRVGRLVAFKECLRHNVVPFLIEDAKKYYYYRGLSEWGKQNGFLLDTCLDGQDTFRRLLKQFDIIVQ